MATGTADDPPPTAELRVESIAVGGDGVAHHDDGRVVFVRGGVPGDRVLAALDLVRSRHAQGHVVEVLERSTDRIDPLCPHAAEGCGGCGWAHVAPSAQRALKVDIVTQALERIGRLDAPDVDAGPELAVTGHRTTVRAAVTGGRAAFRVARGHDLVVVDSCRVAHPEVERILVEGRFGEAEEVTVRVGAATGELLVLVAPAVDPATSIPSEAVVVGADELAAGRRAWFHEEVAGARLRVSAGSFFQSRHDGAEALVGEVARASSDVARGAPMADLYAGVGLFAATVGRGRPVVAVERSRSSVADATVNLVDHDARVVRSAVERWRPSPVDLVIADPARHGLARAGVDKVGATGASRLVLVSCDAGALGRDTSLLVADGWRHDGSTLVDLFPDTPHVEVVSRFVR